MPHDIAQGHSVRIALAAALLTIASGCSDKGPRSVCSDGDASKSTDAIDATGPGTWRGDPGLTGDFSTELARSTPKLERRTRANAILATRNTLFQASGWSLCAVDIESGKTRWSVHRRGGCSFPAVADGKLVAPNATERDTHLYGFDAATGKELWRWTQPKEAGDESGRIGVPSIRDGVVFVGGSYGLFAVDLKTGKLRWRAGVGEAAKGVALSGDLALVANEQGLFAVDASTGDPRWSVDGRFPFVLADGVRAYSAEKGAATAYAIKDGTPVWTSDRVSTESLPALAGGTLFFSEPLKGMVAVDAASGKKRWEKTFKEWIRTPLAVAGDVVYGGTNEGSVLAIDTKTGRQVWRFLIEFEQCLASDAPPQSGPRCIMNHPTLAGWLIQAAAGRLYIGGDPMVVPRFDGGLYVLKP